MSVREPFAALTLALLLTAASATAQTGEQLPQGHPAVTAAPQGEAPGSEDDADEEPSGHSTQGQPGQRGGGIPGAFDPPPDATDEDPAIPAGMIRIEIRDPDNRPLPRTPITVGIVHQSVAKGESREHKALVADDQGKAELSGLETGTGIAYRITVLRDGATFAALPFQLSQAKGMHVVLHVYPVAHDVQHALIVMQGVLFVELKDDRVQIEQALTVYNFGKTAWVPENEVMKLPDTFTAFSANQQMGDQGVDAVDKVGVRLRGTFAPGRRDIDFRWQLPYSDDRDVDFTVGMPPHIAVMRVMAHSAPGMRLVADGFPEAQKQTDGQGQRILLTEKQLRRDEAPLTQLHVTLHDLPVPGPARIIATCLAGLGIVLGFFFALSEKEKGAAASSRSVARKTSRADLLAQVEELERARLADEIGPKAYERTRRQLIDAIARTLASTSRG
jgi:hypothetical protein